MARDAMTMAKAARTLRDPEGVVVWSDEDLLRQFLARSGESAEAAFASLIERHGPVVHRVCREILGGRDESQDAAQAVFLVLARRAGAIRKPGSLGPWLHGVALRVARRSRGEAARRRAAERGKAEILHRSAPVGSGAEALDYDELHEEIDRLPVQYREPIILCYLQGHTQAGAAEALGWPLGTVQTRLHRGRARLRSGLIRRGVALSGLALADLLAPSSASAGSFAPGWAERTARAAVRTAADMRAEALATGMGKARFGRWAKVAALAAIVGLVATVPLIPSDAPRGVVTPAAGPTRTKTDRAKPAPATVPIVAREADRATRPSGPIEEPKRPIRATVSPGAVASRPEKAPIEGRELFERVWAKDDPRGHGGDGLGPVFNGQSCVACHDLGGSGGAGRIDRNIEIATVTEGSFSGGYSYAFRMDLAEGRFEYQIGTPTQAPANGELRADPALLAAIHPGFGGSRSVVLHRFGTDPGYHAWRESVPGLHGTLSVQRTQRNPPPLFGMGQVDAIPDEVIEAAARRRFPGSAQVKGRVSRLKDGRIGRYGWKAQTATLEEFVLSAASGEMGLEVPGRSQAADPRLPGLAARGLDMDEEECEALVDHVRSLPAPVAIRPEDDKDVAQAKAGEATFKAIGCTGCHMPQLGDVEGIYSDLLLHDMGPLAGDASAYTVFVGEAPVARDRPGGPGVASAREWRTPPLWGLRDSGPYMHDGRATRIDQAVALHAGQGASAARRYADLTSRRQRQVDLFLMTLAAPPADR